MRVTRNKRLLGAAGGAAAIGAVATLVAGVTFALFSSQQANPNNAFTAGQVAFGTSTSTTCTINPLQPGDTSAVTTLNQTMNTSGGPPPPYTSITVTALKNSVGVGDKLLFGVGSTAQTYTVTSGGGASAGATALGLGSPGFTPSASISSGTPIFDLSLANGQQGTVTSNTTGNGTCTVPYTYNNGSPSNASSAWLAVDLSYAQTETTQASIPIPYTQTTAPTTSYLVTGSSAASGLQLLLRDTNGAGTNLVNGYQYAQQVSGNTLTGLPTGTSGSVSDILLNTSAVTSRSGVITLDWYLPITGVGDDAFQGATTTFTITVHAVQNAHNPLGSNCAVAAVCSTGMSWF